MRITRSSSEFWMMRSFGRRLGSSFEEGVWAAAGGGCLTAQLPPWSGAYNSALTSPRDIPRTSPYFSKSEIICLMASSVTLMLGSSSK